MTTLFINCPQCGTSFDLNLSRSHEVRDRLHQHMFADARQALERNWANERQKLLEQFAEEQRLKDLEKDVLIGDLRSAIEVLRRKVIQGSQQRQGEALETALLDNLTRVFPMDELRRIAKGKHGGDVLHTIKDGRGTILGRILWEAKNTQGFSVRWLGKLREDALRCNADLAVILTRTLPKEIESFGCVGGTWVTNYESHAGLAVALRAQIVACANHVTIAGNLDRLTQYLRGPEFRTRVETVVSAVSTLQHQLTREQQFVTKSWAERDKLMCRLSHNIAAFSGDLEVVAGTKFADSGGEPTENRPPHTEQTSAAPTE